MAIDYASYNKRARAIGKEIGRAQFFNERHQRRTRFAARMAEMDKQHDFEVERTRVAEESRRKQQEADIKARQDAARLKAKTDLAKTTATTRSKVDKQNHDIKLKFNTDETGRALSADAWGVATFGNDKWNAMSDIERQAQFRTVEGKSLFLEGGSPLDPQESTEPLGPSAVPRVGDLETVQVAGKNIVAERDPITGELVQETITLQTGEEVPVESLDPRATPTGAELLKTKSSVSKSTDSVIQGSRARNTGRDLVKNYNATAHGGQGVINTVSENFGQFLNFFKRWDEGEVDSAQVRAFLKIPDSDKMSKEELKTEFNKQIAIAGRLEMHRELPDSAFVNAEEADEIRSLIKKAEFNAKQTSFIIQSARFFRGDGKLNTSDVDRIKELFPQMGNAKSTIAIINTLTKTIHSEVRNTSRTLAVTHIPSLKNRINGRVDYYSPVDEKSQGAFVFQVRSEAGGRPKQWAMVFDDGSVVLQNGREMNALKANYVRRD